MITIIRRIQNLSLQFYQSELIRFGVIGALGFLVDGVVLYALRHKIGLIEAKIISYIVAFTVTWFFNRAITFRSQDERRLQEWGRYAVIYIATGGLHIGLFAILVKEFLYLHQHPIYASVVASIAMAFLNFLVSKRYVFRVLPAEIS